MTTPPAMTPNQIDAVNAAYTAMQASLGGPTAPAGQAWGSYGGAAGTLRARELIISGTGVGVGILEYSGTPGPGTLVGSWTSVAGVDPYGNSYPAGFSIQGGTIAGANIDGGTIDGTTIMGSSGTFDIVNIESANDGLFVYALI